MKYLLLKIGTKGGSTVAAGAIYRASEGRCQDDFFEVIQEKFSGVENVILGGDVNAHLERDDVTVGAFRRLIVENTFEIVHSGPSFYRSIIPSWLDVILVDSSAKVEGSGRSFIADHDYVAVSYKIVGVPGLHMVKYRCFENLKLPFFQKDLLNLVKNELSNLRFASDIDEALRRVSIET